MKRRSILLLGIVLCVGVQGLYFGCSEKLWEPGDLDDFATLTVKYVHPGVTASPCDDLLPLIDGLGQEQEWNSAEPLFVQMSGANGNGGEDYFLELRALWEDGSRFGTETGVDRLYLMVRYQDNDLDRDADMLAYGSIAPTGDIIPSPIPVSSDGVCDPVLISNDSWSRVNANGREDQVMITMADAASENPSDLVAANRALLNSVGFEAQEGTSIPGENLDVWIWRASRTNLHPVPQVANWATYDPTFETDPLEGELSVPEPVFSRFDRECGFFEDLFVDGSGRLVIDKGKLPYIKNFAPGGTVPIRITHNPRCARGGDDNMGMGEDPCANDIVNGDLPADLALWYDDARLFGVCDTISVSRLGSQQFVWSKGLLPGEFDKIPGWGIQTPTESARDVRGSGGYDEAQTKGFSVRTVEFMRELNTGNGDDIEIIPGKLYRMVIGVFDASGTTGSGSQEIQLIFELPSPPQRQVRDRC
ncbi:MAG: hypothetical protein HKN21_12525 [Candidatus Eisenbacteria bacterium]|uniref:Uncharacterized protein n=1 Tax=Eiseniibacteriota bacterium TaxID=2212470 RepID=A0A7Y2H2Y3_UNCEI|nr:hypothetical protein [Candidatus Eisenbacteria bacterium]